MARRQLIWITFALCLAVQATGAQQIGRLTNLMQLTVNTSFWTRYRSDSHEPRLPGVTFPHAVPGFSCTGSFRRFPEPTLI